MATLDTSFSSILFFALLGAAPSILWLLYFLRQDKHPEPKRLIVRVFLLGMLATIPAIFLEKELHAILRQFRLSDVQFYFLYFIFGVALVEELFKFFTTRIGIFSNRNLDEPVDVMIYIITAALGFAAYENILLLLRLGPVYPVADIIWITAFRFIGATFLHALASGLFGYFLAISLFSRKRTWLPYSLIGLTLATVLHGLFNFYIYTIGADKIFHLIFPTIVLVVIAFFVTLAFRKLKQMKNISKTI